MQLFITQGRKLHNIIVDSDDSISDVKNNLKDIAGIPVEEQDLRWGGRHLDDTKPFSYYGIRAGGFFDLRSTKDAR